MARCSISVLSLFLALPACKARTFGEGLELLVSPAPTRPAGDMVSPAVLGLKADATALPETKEVTTSSTVQSPLKLESPDTLRGVAETKGLLFGCGLSRQAWQDKETLNLVAAQTSLIVPEAFRWSALRPGEKEFDFDRLDKMWEFAKQNAIQVKGSPLVWHNAMPKWFSETATRENAAQILREHVQTVVGHFAGRVTQWDVVAEAVSPGDGRSDGLRQSPWLSLIGPDYIEIAFRTAAAADPKALLFYNDFGLERDGSAPRRAAVLRLLKDLLVKGVPLHGLGLQAHLTVSDKGRFGELAQFLSEVEALGLKIMITELDVADKGAAGDVALRDALVAQVYTEFLETVIARSNLLGIVTWGLSDRFTWLATFRPRADGLPVRPLLFDRDLKKKPAWEAAMGALRKSSARAKGSQ